MQPYNLIFGYGTLKQAEGNNMWMQYAEGKFVSSATTVAKYPLIYIGLPRMYHVPGTGYRVNGELFRVPRAGVLAILDRLEGHPHHYMRRPVQVCAANGKPVLAQAYFFNFPFPSTSKPQFLREFSQV